MTITNWTADDTKQRLDDGQRKARQRSTSEDRSLVYRDFRRTCAPGLYNSDVDQIEWAIRDDVWIPLAVFELTRIDDPRPVAPGYFAAILDRMRVRDAQAIVACAIARRFNVCAYVIAFRGDCSEFWIYNLTRDRGWYHATPDQYRAWIAALHEVTYT